ncbi:RimK family alpha-L-glutamate ligase [Granulicella sp. S156]|jgi:RimK-like ATP-grasp domain|uniref:ATP-grasp domain-containing protein n=1 Tax=Granulicella sp. S156 TaxID=1747224 RepID=UPI00352AEE10
MMPNDTIPNSLPLAIYYEQPNWFKPLFAELDRRGTPYVKLFAPDHFYSPEDHPEEKYSLVFNRMSPSAWNRDHGDQIFYTLGFLEHLESRGVKVINGFKAFSSELSKAGQLTLMDSLGIAYPKARVIHRPAQAEAASEGLRWPIVVKPNIGGSGAGVKRFDGMSQLRAAIAAPTGSPDALQFGLDSTALVQEFIPAQDAHIVRVEVLNGKFLYAIKVHITGETFDLCPADICRTTTGVDLNRAACAIDAPKSGITVEGYQPPAEAIADVERIMQHSGIDIGGVEYITDSRDGQRYYYDTNALSNFVADGPNVIGFDPFAKLVDWLEAEAGVSSQLSVLSSQ